jgi:hypothetical protein
VTSPPRTSSYRTLLQGGRGRGREGGGEGQRERDERERERERERDVEGERERERREKRLCRASPGWRKYDTKQGAEEKEKKTKK